MEMNCLRQIEDCRRLHKLRKAIRKTIFPIYTYLNENTKKMLIVYLTDERLIKNTYRVPEGWRSIGRPCRRWKEAWIGNSPWNAEEGEGVICINCRSIVNILCWALKERERQSLLYAPNFVRNGLYKFWVW